MNYGKLELRLRELVEQLLSEGWNVRPRGTFIDDNRGQCCAVGAAAIESGAFGNDGLGSIYDGASKAVDEVGYINWSLVSSGFEYPERGHEEPEFQIGARIRRDYCDTTDEVVS